MPIISDKARKFIAGRRGQFKRIESAVNGQENIIWVHASSFGEFEEARPVIKEIRTEHPEYKILATFFSPSGYEFLKNDPIADWVFYLPLDTPWNARRFLDLVRPQKMILSISDYWLCFLTELHRRNIPAYLISARFVPGMIYFRPLGFLYRIVFRKSFTKILVRDQQSMDLLKGIGINRVALIGDPRMDRVIEIARNPWSDEIVDKWSGGQKVFVGGSTLPDEDDEIMIALANAYPQRKLLLIPHEQEQKEIAHLRDSIKCKTVLYTEAGDDVADAQVLIVNTVGMLSKLYRYGYASYVGSGFEDSPHSVIESAVYGCPVSFGPNICFQHHCQLLHDCGGGKIIHDENEFLAWYKHLIEDPEYLEQCSKAAKDYCYKTGGVAKSLMKELF